MALDTNDQTMEKKRVSRIIFKDSLNATPNWERYSAPLAFTASILSKVMGRNKSAIGSKEAHFSERSTAQPGKLALCDNLEAYYQ